jgi:hypothetical protein
MMKRIEWIAWLLCGFALLLLNAQRHVEASTARAEAAEIGIVSDALACLAIHTDQPVAQRGSVNLRWQGTPRQARLILTIAGAEAAHPIKINGQPVATAPVFSDGEVCGEGEVFYLDIPPSMIRQGANEIELTADAQAGDGWSAADLRLEVLGNLLPAGGDEVAAANAAATISTISYSNRYDPRLLA